MLPHVTSILILLVAAALAGCADRAPQAEQSAFASVHSHDLPPLKLTREHKRLLAAASTKPRTALDYYMLLPKSYFKIMPDSRERRVSYIDLKSLSDDFLTASHWIECDGGGFAVELKLYRTPSKTFVVLRDGHGEKIFDDGKPREGEPSVLIERPSLWLHSGGKWLRQRDTAIPKISAKRVLAKYHRDWDADKQYTDQEKFIWIEYIVSPTSPDIVLMGRENFQPSTYEYGRLKWRGDRFSLE